MIKNVTISKVSLQRLAYVPQLLRTLIAAAESGAPLALAAHRLTTGDIALRLDISARTAQFHFDCIRTKLGAAARQEAVARGIVQGVMMA